MMKRQRENEGTTLESWEMQNCTTSTTTSPEVFECKTCNRRFTSFQALGGHRASHNKRVKLQYCEQQQRRNEPNNEVFSSINQVVAKVSVLKRSCNDKVFCLDLNLTPVENDLKLLLFGKLSPKVHLSSF